MIKKVIMKEKRIRNLLKIKRIHQKLVPEVSMRYGWSHTAENQVTDQLKVEQDNEKSNSDVKEDDTTKNEENIPPLSTDQIKMINSTDDMLSPLASMSSAQHMVEDNENRKRDEKVTKPNPNENSSIALSFSVSQELYA